MFNVFVSYSTTDLTDVQELEAKLATRGIEVFVAHHSVLPGESLTQEIKNAIGRCDIFILLWSQNAKDSDWVAQEIGIANQLNKLIVPLLFEENLELPGFIRDLKYIDVPKDRQLAFEQAQDRVLGVYAKKLEVEKQKQTEIIFFSGVGLFLFWAFSQS